MYLRKLPSRINLNLVLFSFCFYFLLFLYLVLQVTYDARTARSAVGKGAGCAPTPTRVRVLTPAGAHRGFSLVYSRSQVGLCLTRGWPTMIRVTCLSHSEPGGDFGDLSAACIPRYKCRFSSRTVCVCGCVSVVLV